MDKALYVAMSGAKEIMLSQAVHANNLANANTDGFRADFVNARSQAVYYGDGHPTRAYAMTENPATDFHHGPLIHTDREFDIAPEGDSWIAVQSPDGSEAYTRAGSLNADSQGILRTSDGLAVIGNGGPISIPPYETVEIAVDGTITVRAVGQGAEVLVTVDRIKLVSGDSSNLFKANDGLIRPIDGQELPLDPAARVVSGFVEGSNVNPVNAMVDMLALARQYEMNVKLMKAADEAGSASAQLLRM